MVEYVSFHGTKKSIVDREIRFSPKNVLITNLTAELECGRLDKTSKNYRRPKSPGSLGYGFYTFVQPKELTRDFISRQMDDYKILEVHSQFEDAEVLDLNVIETRTKFHAYRKEFLRHADKILKGLGYPENSHKQHAMDGIVIESFINKLFTKEKKKVTAVIMWTFTPCTDKDANIKMVSFVPNGLELCIRSNDNIKLLKEGDV
ncbi:hypothetical protein [Enterococcus sp. AZ007]|uniref:hypothetical protein n=1 Tax=Enterococcus sp. AZ007 TaxID=2774839 RepID=UPI003F2316C9